MNLELSLKTQNVRSFNMSENGLVSMRKKVQAAVMEDDDIIMLTNVQLGGNKTAVEREFLFGGKNPYEIYTNSTVNDARGVLIATKIKANIQVIDIRKDEDDRVLILKTVIGNETITLGCLYDDNRNNTNALQKVDEFLTAMDVKHGLIIGGDYNVIVNRELDQIGYENQHLRTKAVKYLTEWDEKGTLVDIYRKKHKKGTDVTYVPDTEKDRINPKLGRRLDKFLVSEDMNIKETTIQHVSDNVYKQELNMSKKFDHGAVRLVYNKKKSKVGPGQFKLDPYMIKTGALDSIIKEVIYESNVYNAEIT